MRGERRDLYLVRETNVLGIHLSISEAQLIQDLQIFSNMSVGVPAPQRPNSGPSLPKKIAHFTFLFTHSCYVQSIVPDATENVKMCDTVYTLMTSEHFRGGVGSWTTQRYERRKLDRSSELEAGRHENVLRTGTRRNQSFGGGMWNPSPLDYKVGASVELGWKGVWRPNHKE